MHGSRVLNIGGLEAAYSGGQEMRNDGGIAIVSSEIHSDQGQPQQETKEALKPSSETTPRHAKWWGFWRSKK
ncbi:MAG: hypothetical protein ACI8ZM_000968 [Crocinitomix sp.]|jgi:hypothetical protein